MAERDPNGNSDLIELADEDLSIVESDDDGTDLPMAEPSAPRVLRAARPPGASGLFSSADWQGAVDEWGAALPVAEERAAGEGTAADELELDFSAPATTAEPDDAGTGAALEVALPLSVSEPLGLLSWDDVTEPPAAPASPISFDGAPGLGLSAAELGPSAAFAMHDSTSGALVIPDLEELAAGAIGLPGLLPAPAASAPEPPTAARPADEPWAPVQESNVHFEGLPELPFGTLGDAAGGPLTPDEDPVYESAPPVEPERELTIGGARAPRLDLDQWLRELDQALHAAGDGAVRPFASEPLDTGLPLAAVGERTPAEPPINDNSIGPEAAAALLLAARRRRREGAAEDARRHLEHAAQAPELAAAAARESLALPLRPAQLATAWELLAQAGPVGERATYAELANEARRLAGNDPAEDLAPGDAADETPGHPAPALRAFSFAESALLRGDRRRAADHLMTFARHVGGPLGAACAALAARTHELQRWSDHGDEAWALVRVLEPEHPALVVAAIRAAVRLPRDAAARQLQRLAGELPDRSLRAALARQAAALALAGAEPERAALALAAGGIGAWDELPLWGRQLVLEVDTPEAHTVRETLLGRADDGLAPAERSLLAVARARAALADGRASFALALLAEGLQAAPTAVPLALAAETVARSSPDPVTRASALELWGDFDPARRAHARVLRAEALAALGDEDGARAALDEIVARAPEDPAFWTAAWMAVRAHDPAAAAAALERGAEAWTRAGGDEIGRALRERAGDLRLSQLPARAVARALASSSRHEAVGDDPRRLALGLLESSRDPDAIVALFRAAATTQGTPLRRALEAAVWMIEAGDTTAAAQMLLARVDDAPLDAATRYLLERLARAPRDASLARTILGRLEREARDDHERALLVFRRAEALEQAGDLRGAADVYRELAAGPLGADADVAVRRVLWTMPDAAALDAIYRDEAEGRLGAGLAQAAAAALVERARIEHELFGNAAAARALWHEALARDPEALAPRWALLVDAASRGRHVDVARQLRALAERVEVPLSSACAALAALLEESRGDPAQANRQWAEEWARARRYARGHEPLMLGFRALLASGGLESGSPASNEIAQHIARAQVDTTGADARFAATLLFTAAATAESDASAREMAELLTREALTLDRSHPLALLLLAELTRARGAITEAIELQTRLGETLGVAQHRADAFTAAGDLAHDELGDSARAEDLWQRALSAEPAHTPAFARLRAAAEARGDARGLADLYAHRLQSAPAPEALSLRLARAALLAQELRDRNAAKAELRAILNEDPQQLEALAQLAQLELEDGAYAIAAELTIRLARFERDPGKLLDIFLRIGRIYHKRLPDPKLATQAYERVLRLNAEQREALEALSELYTKQNDLRKAIAITAPLAADEGDAVKRLTLLLRLGDLYERSGDLRRASATLRRAAEEAPRSLQAVGELARFYERSKETQARQVLLDSSIALLRGDVARDPSDLDALRPLIPLLRWRGRNAGSTAAAQLLGALTPDAHEKREVASWSSPPARGRRLTPLANPDVDERAMAPAVPPGLRHVMARVGPLLARTSRPDLKRFGVNRAERFEAGQGVRSIIDPIAVDLGVRGFDVYVSTTQPTALAVEPGEPPALIIGADLAALGPVALRFIAGLTLRLVATHFDALAAGSPFVGAALLAGLVQSFHPDFRHPELDDAAVAAQAQRFAKLLPRSLRAELSPFIAELATPFSATGLHAALLSAGARVGLLASGDLAASLEVLLGSLRTPLGSHRAAIAQTPIALELVEFALSPEYDALARILDAVT